jgi:trans-aconitate 2-methyltransferase
MTLDLLLNQVNAMKQFEFDGEKYKQASTHQKEWGERLIAELHFNGDEAILDLGCGDGALTAKLAQLVSKGRVIGIDASQSMIDTAQKLNSPNLRFEHKDINEIDFQNEFDLIFSNATLHWVKDHHKLLENCYRALKPGGYIRFNFAGDGNCAHFNQTVQSLIQEAEFQRYFHNFEWPWFMPGIEAYREIVVQIAFNEVRLWEENADRNFPDAAAITKWIDQPSLVPFLGQISDDKERQVFRDIVVARMLAETRTEQGTFFETFRRINLFAKK